MPGIEEDYQRTFGTEHGRRVLVDMLLEAGFWDLNCQADDLAHLAAKNALDNFAKGVMNKAGFWRHDILDKLMREWLKLAAEARINAG